jgi:hypothetical protein
MTTSRLGQLARQATGFPKFLRGPVTVDRAVSVIRRQLEHREENFLIFAKQVIYDVAHSPYRRLLLWAGCDFADLRASVRSRGIERTLEKLRDAGVYLTLDEFKSRAPIVRNGLIIETVDADFDNPFLSGGPIYGVTSGTRSTTGSRVTFNWDFMAEETAYEVTLYAAHEVLDAPLALWFPVPPGIAGIHNLLMAMKQGVVPERWFSQSRCSFRDTSLEARGAIEFVIWTGRAMGFAVPRPEFADLSHGEKVARWIENALKRSPRAVLRTFGSSALRMADHALATGANLRGGLVFAGGEPLTEPRRKYLEAAGLEVYARYVTTEIGVVAAGCPQRTSTDEMHFYSGRLAAIHRDPNLKDRQADSLLYTTLTTHTAKVMFNGELGDCGAISTRGCRCALGQLGLEVHLAGVRSYEKITIEGMTILSAELDAIIGAAVERAGGRPDAYQFREVSQESGLHRLIISISPDVANFNQKKFVAELVDELRRGGPRMAMAAEFWGKAESFVIVREEPQATAGHKLVVMKR